MPRVGARSLTTYWDRYYRAGHPIWDSDRPTSELKRVVRQLPIHPCRTVELGCGTGATAVWLARQGFAVTAIDISPTAIRRARERAAAVGVRQDSNPVGWADRIGILSHGVRFVCGDLRGARWLGGPFDLFIDCGCYGAMRLTDAAGYLRALRRLTRPGTLGLVLTGNAREPEDEAGPPVLTEGQIRRGFGRLFDILRLREFRFDADQGHGKEYLGWSCLLRRR
jgi:SAM-dependent methyltransferase